MQEINSSKKESIADLAQLLGTGLSASNGVSIYSRYIISRCRKWFDRWWYIRRCHINVQVDDSSIEIDSDTLQVKASGITNAMLGGSIANSKLANSSITVTSWQ